MDGLLTCVRYLTGEPATWRGGKTIANAHDVVRGTRAPIYFAPLLGWSVTT